MVTSRTEIADYVAAAFDPGPVTREELLAAAICGGAPVSVVDELERLPRRTFRDLRELWPELPGLPVEV